MMRTGALVRLTRQSEAFWVGRLTTQNASANRGRMVSTTWPIPTLISVLINHSDIFLLYGVS